VPVIAQPKRQRRSAAPWCFDAIGAAQAKAPNWCLVDTAGRLQNPDNLMEELGQGAAGIIDGWRLRRRGIAVWCFDASQGQNGLRRRWLRERRRPHRVVLTKPRRQRPRRRGLAVASEAGLGRSALLAPAKALVICGRSNSFEFVEALLRPEPPGERSMPQGPNKPC